MACSRRWSNETTLATTARVITKWVGPESNRRHMDFQSIALPAELPTRASKFERHILDATPPFSRMLDSESSPLRHRLLRGPEEGGEGLCSGTRDPGHHD